MELKMSAIDVLTVQTMAKRAKGHFDAQIAAIKEGKNAYSVRGYGYGQDMRNYLNPAFDLEALKRWSDIIESDLRSIKSAMTRHNATAKVAFTDSATSDMSEDKEVTIFEAFNMLKDLEADLNKVHRELAESIVFVGPKVMEQEELDKQLLPAVEVGVLRDRYQDILRTILSIKRGIAKANNRTIKVDISSEYLLVVAGEIAE